jgi:RNA polymerase sigma-70 factor (ECF subfamily)
VRGNARSRAYLEASRSGDLASLLAVLDPEVVLRVDPAALPVGAPTEVRGVTAVAERALGYGRCARLARLALVDGRAGLVLAPRGRLSQALAFTYRGDRIVGVELVADPERLRAPAIAAIDE